MLSPSRIDLAQFFKPGFEVVLAYLLKAKHIEGLLGEREMKKDLECIDKNMYVYVESLGE